MEGQTPVETPCDRYVALIHDRLDGMIDPSAARALDEHLASCAACRALLADLESIRRAAVTLPDLTPRQEVWAALERQLDVERAARPTPFWTGARVALAMAATLVVAVAASVWLFRTPPARTGGAGQATGAAPQPVIQSQEALVKDVDEHLRIADEHYTQAIAGLEQVVKGGEGELEPAVAATLQKNLGVIDQAIRESREAIKSQPNSELAQTSLFEAFRQKVALLEDTVALINVMRKGDQAGAAKILKGISKS
jgi:anti-sigma factor RsiW